MEVLKQYVRIDPFEARYNIAPSEPPIPAGSSRKSERRSDLRAGPARCRGPSGGRHDDLAIDSRLGPAVRYPKIFNRQCPSRNDVREKNSFSSCLAAAWPSVASSSPRDFTNGRMPVGEQGNPGAIGPLNEEHFNPSVACGKSPNGVLSCTIVTVDANPLMKVNSQCREEQASQCP